MDQNSHAGSSTTGGGGGGPDWGTMGGSVGDGFLQQQTGSGPPPPPYRPPPPSVPAAATPPAYGGSGTAAPAPGGYAARAAAANASYQANQTSVIPSITQTTPSVAARGGGGAAGGGSYAARSAQAYAVTQQQQQGGYFGQAAVGYSNMPSPQYNNNNNNNNIPSYGTPSPQPNTMASPPGGGMMNQQGYLPPTAHQDQGYPIARQHQQQNQGYPQLQQQQVPQQNQGYPPQPQASPSRPPANHSNNTYAKEGYAARAAQAYASQQQPQAYGGGANSVTQAASSVYPAADASASLYNTQPRYPNQPPVASVPAQQQQQQQGGAYPPPSGAASTVTQPSMATTVMGTLPASLSPAVQQRLLADATRKIQEHAYYMKQAMEQQQLPTVLERAAYLAGELGGLPHGAQPTTGATTGVSLTNTGLSAQLTPKNYYELYMRALEELPSLEEYLLGLAQKNSPAPTQPDQVQIVLEAPRAEPAFAMRELYDCVHYCPRVLPRLYLQITAGSALLRSGDIGSKWMLNDLLQAVKCEQNPIRGLFLRNYLLTALRDKLPDGLLSSPSTADEASPENTGKEQDDSEKPATDAGTAVDDDPEQEAGTVEDSYEFVLANFMEMNKLWVRLQHLPGEGRNKDVKKRRERERNDLRILVGTNLVRLSQLEGVTSKIYGESILPRILEHIVAEGDPLSQAYLMDCLVQVFPDEYHIETMPILLGVCPRLRDKVNVRTILNGLMDRLANYLAEEELLDESDTNQVKLTLARDSFGMFEDCVQKVYNARGPKLTAKEVIRLQTALLQFSLRCYPGNMEQITQCMSACVSALHQANASYEMTDATMVNVPPKQLDEVAVAELEKLLSIPLESLALKVLQLQHYGQLITFLPWNNRRGVAIKLLEAVDQAGSPPHYIQEIEQLFQLIEPLLRDEGSHQAIVGQTPSNPTAQATNLMANLGISAAPTPAFESTFIEDGATSLEQVEKEAALVCKLIHLLKHSSTDVTYDMLTVARRGVQVGGRRRMARVLASVVIAGLKLARRVYKKESETRPKTAKETESAEATAEVAIETKPPPADDSPEDAVPEETKPETPEETKEGANDIVSADEPEPETKDEELEEPKVSCRQVFIFVQETIRNLGKANTESGVKMYLEAALVADSLAQSDMQDVFSPVAYEMLCQAYSLYEEHISDSKVQLKCVTSIIGTLMACGGLSVGDYETLVTKSAQLSAKLVKKPDQCRMVALCAHLFFPASKGESFGYRNAQRSLECLQRSLKLADGCTTANASNVDLFVELLEHYLYLFEQKSPTISAGYITGLVSLIKEHLNNLSGSPGVMEAKKHFVGVIRDIKRKKVADETSTHFKDVEVDNIGV